ITILTASFLGLPISTSQVVSSAIVGVGASERIGKVRWGVAGDILTAWVITIPVSALFSAGIYAMFVWLGVWL
ncbi:MAG: inorganic phosphate transporter, partial [Anaerolineales bacterium]|nr:inorganic phosphate transporter [Anaerolineales bacterium]